VAEEVALLLAISDAQPALMDGQYGDEVAALPATAHDEDWQSVTNALLGTRHIDWQLSPGDTPEWLGDPPPSTSWFDAFEGADARPVGRGFRR
jgi:hypothetical protein